MQQPCRRRLQLNRGEAIAAPTRRREAATRPGESRSPTNSLQSSGTHHQWAESSPHRPAAGSADAKPGRNTPICPPSIGCLQDWPQRGKALRRRHQSRCSPCPQAGNREAGCRPVPRSRAISVPEVGQGIRERRPTRPSRSLTSPSTVRQSNSSEAYLTCWAVNLPEFGLTDGM